MTNLTFQGTPRLTRLLQVGSHWRNPDDVRGASTVFNNVYFDVVVAANSDMRLVHRPNTTKRTGLKGDGTPYMDADENVYVEVPNEFFDQVVALQEADRAAKKAEEEALGELTPQELLEVNEISE